MDETRYDLINENKKEMSMTPFVVMLIGVIVMVVALILPYVTAVGNLADYIEKNPDRVENESLELTASDLANVPVVSASNIVIGLFGEDEGIIAKVIVAVLGSCTALTVLFVMIKKPVVVIIFDLLTCGVFFFLNFMMRETFIVSEETYAWGIGYYVLIIAAIIAFAGAVWMIVTNINIKREAKKKIEDRKVIE